MPNGFYPPKKHKKSRKGGFPKPHRKKVSLTIPGVMLFYVIVVSTAFVIAVLVHAGIFDFSQTLDSTEITKEALKVDEPLITTFPTQSPNGTDSLVPDVTLKTSQTYDIAQIEMETFNLINLIRLENGLNEFQWDDSLYLLSKAHTQAMAERGELFHSPQTAPYAENCWGGVGYYYFSPEELAEAIVDSWMSSPLHKAWLLHEPLRQTVVSIVITPTGQFASWTFWMSEAGQGPELIRRIYNEWIQETGGNIPWLDWLRLKGYIE